MNERAKKKESRQNNREMRVHDDEIKENITQDSINIEKFTMSCYLHAKPKDTKKVRETLFIS